MKKLIAVLLCISCVTLILTNHVFAEELYEELYNEENSDIEQQAETINDFDNDDSDIDDMTSQIIPSADVMRNFSSNNALKGWSDTSQVTIESMPQN